MLIGLYIALCLVIFLAEVYGINLSLTLPHWLGGKVISGLSLLENGALSRQGLLQGAWWSLVTCHLIHGSWGHLTSNMLGLWMYSTLLKRWLSPGKLGLLMGLSMLGTDLATILKTPSPTIGASGVVYGFMGCFLVLALRYELRVSPETRWQSIRGVLLYAAILTFMNVWGDPNLNIWGHLGGFAVGLIFGLCFPLSYRVEPDIHPEEGLSGFFNPHND